MGETVHLNIPISEEEIRKLRLNDVVYLTGDAYSMLYADHYTLIMERVREGKTVPMELEGGVLYNTGAIYRRSPSGGYDMRAVGATTSSKFNEQTPEFIRMTGVRAVIGKGGMDQAVSEAMKENGCVYLAIAGGCSAVYTPNAELVDEYWPELMPVDNQRLKIRFREFGPLLVAMDAHGGSLYRECADCVDKIRPAIYEKLGINAGEGKKGEESRETV